jgi:hypothetical protein
MMEEGREGVAVYDIEHFFLLDFFEASEDEVKMESNRMSFRRYILS